MRDRFSVLPDEMLVHILLFLPTTKLRARTSVLSRRWRHLWTYCRAIDLHREGHDCPSNSSLVDRCIRACRTASLRRFAADVLPVWNVVDGGADGPSPIDAARCRAERWVRFAAGRSVEELRLLFFCGATFPAPPPSVLACCRSLTALELGGCDWTDFPCPAGGFPSLRTLRLNVGILPEKKLPHLLAMCPLLESLSLKRCRCLLSIEVSSSVNPRLMDLCFKGHFWAVVLDVPRLRTFEYGGNITTLSLKSAPPNLREAKLHSPERHTSWSKQAWKEIMSAICDVEILSVTAWFFEFMAVAGGIGHGKFVFENLRAMVWFVDSFTDSNLGALFSFLRGCPQLEKLYIKLGESMHTSTENTRVYSFYKDGDAEQPPDDEVRDLSAHQHVGGSLEEPAGERVLPRLKSATVYGFSSGWHDKQLVETLLQRATALERLRLQLSSEGHADADVIRELVFGLPRASPVVRISLRSPDL